MLHAAGPLSKSDFSAEKDRRSFRDGKGFEDLSVGIFSDAGDEVFAFINLSLRVTLSSVEGTLRRCFVWLFLFPSGYIQETILEANSEGTTGSRPCVLESYFD